MYEVQVSVRGPEGVLATKAFKTNDKGAKELVARFDRGVASHRIMEGIESVEAENEAREIGGPPLNPKADKAADGKAKSAKK